MIKTALEKTKIETKCILLFGVLECSRTLCRSTVFWPNRNPSRLFTGERLRRADLSNCVPWNFENVSTTEHNCSKCSIGFFGENRFFFF